MGDEVTAIRGDFAVVSTLHPKTGVDVERVDDFKDCIISARRWLYVERLDITLMGPYETPEEARCKFAAASVVDCDKSVLAIQRVGAKSYVVARVASGVNMERGAWRRIYPSGGFCKSRPSVCGACATRQRVRACGAARAASAAGA